MTAIFRCGRFPVGEVPIRTRLGLVTFVDGRAEVTDPDLATALLEVDPSFQITQEGGEHAAGGEVARARATRGRKRTTGG